MGFENGGLHVLDDAGRTLCTAASLPFGGKMRFRVASAVLLTLFAISTKIN